MLSLCAAMAAGAAGAKPGARDPTLVHRVPVGAPSGAWPMQRGDGARSGRTRLLFPTNPVVSRRIPLFADLATSPVVDEREHLVVATKDGKLIEILPNGEVASNLTLDAPAVLGPVLSNDGTRFVVTRDGVVVGVSRDGIVSFTTPLGATRGQAVAEPLTTTDGCAVAALGPRATKIGEGGEIRGVAELDEVIVAMTESPRALYLSTETGRVFEWTPPASPRAVGNFGGKPTSEVVASTATTLLTVVRNSTLVEIDVRDGARTLLAGLAPDAVIDTPALTPSGELRLMTRSGWLLGYSKSHETFRHSTTPPSTLPVFNYPDAMLPPLVDPAGSIAYVTSAATVGVALPDGEIRTAVLSECGAPSALVPVGRRVLAAFCRSGFIALISDSATSADIRGRAPAPAKPHFP
ncbi:MAG TPA: hypothetical protein VHC69_29450 [Polyangiaceae bacterium]|nr:hypothetical protein [Polyangiaceae bacterium]